MEDLENIEGENLKKITQVPEEAEKTILELGAQKKHWRNKAIDPTTGKPYSELLEEERKKNVPPQEPNKPAPAGVNEAERDFLIFNPSLTSEIGKTGVEELFAYARGKGVRPDEALITPGGKAIVEHLKTQKRLADNTPPPSDRTPGFVPPKPFSELSQKEKKEKYPETVEKLIGKGKQ